MKYIIFGAGSELFMSNKNKALILLILIIISGLIVYLLRNYGIIPNNTEAFFWFSISSFWISFLIEFIQNKISKQ